jgi:molybdopterin biosynthesis enzyme
MSDALPALMSLEDARTRMLDELEALPPEAVALGDAAARVLAETLTSRHTLPPWCDSTLWARRPRVEWQTWL